MGEKLSIRMISEKTGLSVATVSRALDPRYAHKVREETRNRVIQCCNEHNYRPSNAGRSLVTGKMFKVGFISGNLISDAGSKPFSLYFQGLCNALQEQAYSLVLLHAARDRHLDDKVVDLLLSHTADAYIMGRTIVSDQVYQTLLACGVPVLVLGQTPPAIDLLTIRRDLVPAYEEIWKRADCSWKGRILFCGQIRSNPNTAEKYEACCTSAPAGYSAEFLDIPYANTSFSNPDSMEKYAERYLEKLLDQKLILCDTDILALGIRQLLARHGRKAGRDYALVGFDNLDRIQPGILDGLATVDCCWEDMGSESARIILDSIRSLKKNKTVFPARFVPGETFPMQQKDQFYRKDRFQ